MKRTSLAGLAAVVLAAVAISACSDDNTSGPPATVNFASVQQSLVANCSACHAAGSGRFFTVDMDSAQLQQSGLLDPANPAQSTLLLKATNTTPHGGGVIAGFTAADQAKLLEWAARIPAAAPRQLDALRIGAGTSIAAPVVDGFFDPVWSQAPRTSIAIGDGWGEAAIVTLQASYDADYLYMLVVWADDKASARRQPWVKQADGTWLTLPAKTPAPTVGTSWTEYLGTASDEDNSRFNYEDKMALIWNTYGASTVAGFDQQGCTVMCHDPSKNNGPGTSYNYTAQELAAKKYTNSPAEIADMWHWKSVRMNQHGKIDDQHVKYWVPGPTGAANGGRGSDAGGGGYANNLAVNGFPEYRGPSLTVPPYYIMDSQKQLNTVSALNAMLPGQEMANMITSGPTGLRADIDAKGIYNSGSWAVEIRRRLVTGDANDVQFDDLARQYVFGVSIFDNAQIEHRYAPLPARLVFRP